jgi:hypothetical protein
VRQRSVDHFRKGHVVGRDEIKVDIKKPTISSRLIEEHTNWQPIISAVVLVRRNINIDRPHRN